MENKVLIYCKILEYFLIRAIYENLLKLFLLISQFLINFLLNYRQSIK